MTTILAARVARTVAAMTMLSVVAGCEDGTADRSTAGPASTARRPVPDDIVGRWAHYDVVAYADRSMKTLIISYGFTDFEMEGDDLFAQEVFCTARQASDQPIRTVISDEATQAIRPRLAPASFRGEPGAWTIDRPATPTPIGIRLDDPANESLPTDPTDPRVADDDGDGKPGITVSVSTEAGDPIGELYIARREIFAYVLDQVGPDEFRGTVTDGSEQLVIGATNPALNVPTAWEQHPDPAKSPMILKRATADWDCDRLVAEIPELFGEPPDVDW